MTKNKMLLAKQKDGSIVIDVAANSDKPRTMAWLGAARLGWSRRGKARQGQARLG